MGDPIKVLACGTNDSKMGSVSMIIRPRGKSRLAEIYAAMYGMQAMPRPNAPAMRFGSMAMRPSVASILAIKVRLAGRGYSRINGFPVAINFTVRSESAIASFHEWVMFGGTTDQEVGDFLAGYTNWPSGKDSGKWSKILRSSKDPIRSMQ